MTTFKKDIEVEFELNELTAAEVIEELEERIDCKHIDGFHSEANGIKMKPLIEENKKKLAEIRMFLIGY